MLFNPANATYWIFLAIGIILFLLTIFSGGSGEDIEMDMDADADIDAEAELGSVEILGWLGIGKAPLILLLAVDFSLWGAIGWMLNVGVGNLIGTIPTDFLGLGGVILISSAAASLFVGSVISNPLGKIFASFSDDTSSDRFIGCVGTVTSKQVPYVNSRRVGQVDVFDRARNLVTISVTLPQWAEIVPERGERVLIVDREKNHYAVIAKDSSDEQRWLDDRSQIRNSQ